MLRAEGPLPTLADKRDLFSRCIGAWAAEVVFYGEDGKEAFHAPGEWATSAPPKGAALAATVKTPDKTHPTETAHNRLSSSRAAARDAGSSFLSARTQASTAWRAAAPRFFSSPFQAGSGL